MEYLAYFCLLLKGKSNIFRIHTNTHTHTHTHTQHKCMQRKNVHQKHKEIDFFASKFTSTKKIRSSCALPRKFSKISIFFSSLSID